MLIFVIFVAETCATQCQERGYNNCCEDYEWDEILGNCTRCKPGFYGINCNKTCRYPHFGYACQQNCSQCSEEVCDFAKGCSILKVVECYCIGYFSSFLKKTLGKQVSND
uniref:Uncharacterized protein n=1 Tax=Magallana gigas TaxID=29159 RepID=A0A8W8LPN0_MAGGI